MVKYIKSSQGKKANGNNDDNKDVTKTIYVYPSKKCVFLVVSDPKESKYSAGVRIKPLLGKFYNAKEKKSYDARQLNSYDVILNVDKEVAKSLKKGMLVVRGFNSDLAVWGDDNGDKKSE